MKQYLLQYPRKCIVLSPSHFFSPPANPSIESHARFVARNMSYSLSRTQANLECMREGRARPIWVWQIWIVNLDAIKSVSPDSGRSVARIAGVWIRN